MPRPKPDPQAVIPQVIACAIRLIDENGFEQLTMKDLALACDMSVGKLYHFFPSKDDLFLTLEIEYFEGLLRALRAVNVSNAPITASFRAVLEAYYAYATAHFELYKLVSMPPKVYTHYLGTEREALARKELEAALAVVNLVRELFTRLKAGQGLDQIAMEQEFLFCINAMHGLILMSRSAAWPYISRQVESEADLQESTTPIANVVSQQLDLVLQKLG